MIVIMIIITIFCPAARVALRPAPGGQPRRYWESGFRRVWLKQNLNFKGGVPRPSGSFPECLSQAILAGISLAGRLGVRGRMGAFRRCLSQAILRGISLVGRWGVRGRAASRRAAQGVTLEGTKGIGMGIVSNNWFDRVLYSAPHMSGPSCWPMFKPPSLGPP